MRMNINQFPCRPQPTVNLHDATVKSNTAAPPSNMVFHDLKKERNKAGLVHSAGFRADAHPWPHSWHSQDIIKSKFKRKVSLKLLRSLFPTFPGFVEYADAIFCLDFQITPGSQLAGENLFKLPSNCKHRKWNHTAFERCKISVITVSAVLTANNKQQKFC